MTPEMIKAIIGEIGILAIRFYFLNQKLDELAGLTPEESKARFDKALVAFEAKPPEALKAMIE